jgi:lipoprotein-anchoring transpeptidase ErfK/SrfK
MEEGRASHLVDGHRINVDGNSASAALYKAGPGATSWPPKQGQAIMTIRWAGWLAASVLAAVLWTSAAQAELVVHIDKSSQRMSVSIDGATRYNWAISTGRDGYGTPGGTYHPQSMMRTYFSKKYYNAPMPHAIFFYYGFAIHGTNDISRLGGPASHGCVRLHPANAATLFALVQRNGPRNTMIEISN